ncbi:MAG: right-handed parallel beta-helix repeat-containing protein, partial [Chitinophagaceae bacterium]
MRKFYGSFFLKNLFLFSLLLSGIFASAQTPQFFKGVGTGGNTIPMNTAGSHTQQIYQPGDFNLLPNSGLITKIYFRNTTAGTTGTYTNFSVAFLQNNLAAFPNNTFLTGFTTALSAGTITINGNATAGGWYEIPLTTPFPYDNSQTLIVEIKYTSRTGGMSGPTSTAVGNKRLSIITAPGAATGNLSTIWGDFGMDIGSATPCTDPPTAGTITPSTSSTCLGVPFTINYSGGTNGTGQTYQWQISPDNISWSNIPGATSPTLNTSQTATNYYRLVVTCGTSVNSNTVQVNTGAAVSGTFTINSALPTGGTNFQSFNAAYDYIKCGIGGPVVFNVDAASGPYNEQLIMIPVPGASATNTVTFNGNGRTIQNTSTTTGQRGVIKLDGADHIKFDNLVINANGSTTTEYGFGVHLINNADSNAITNCAININTSSTSTNYAGIVMSASHTSATGTGSTLSDGNRFEGNTITGGYYGITSVGSTTEANRENIIRGNTIKDFYFYGIYISGNFDTQIDSNSISRPTRATVSTFNGIYLTSLNVSVDVTRNMVSDPFGGAPASTSASNSIYITGVVLIQHNTILMDGPGASGTSLTRGFYQTTAAGGITFENNIVVITRGGAAAKYALYFNTATSDIISNRNDLFLNSPGGNTFTGYINATPQATLADWQTASGDDANSVANNPFFANIATGDLRPTNASIDNLGAPLGVLVDITGAARSATTPDIGAYEFTPGACSAPPVAGTAIVNPAVVCANDLVQLSVSGNSTGLGQTFQWQFSTAIGGPFTSIGAPANNPGLSVNATVTGYYRLAVTCSGNTQFTAPVLLTVNPALPAGTYTINKT